ncbi:endonuclease/exonuclease/phosphatase family protein [Flavobacterium sp. xlx-214]|uniref:endonuclease/exonuclease/phosphatase family protein n=1 Tax=unclassified Flavobacterium TaxID=196869 RepID=UPI0013D8B970|nr:MULTISPECIES: endonuclease/exonuclease/phosphatase family protein [unclassified Flavobacterium]MBA5792003.1 endonuclease/exonuclease/phosphatase family protein [Flavobacterium sp. xlx-221]QMI84257.1 endonuclease/exonuclease/phosphatase family protein [Flavobacterium sp. xlx-214]
MKLKLLLLVALLGGTVATQAQKKSYMVHTVSFYNLENLFDTIRDEKIYDEEWTPKGERSWDGKKYQQKLENLSRAIAEIGTDENPNMPTILGVSELENKKVLEDLVAMPKLQKAGYGIVHYDSPDRRGIDVALLYQTKHFKPTSSKNIPLYIYDASDAKYKNDNNGKGKRIYTRDQLLVTGLLDGEEMHFIVNHWPSRSGGEKKSSPNREAAAALNKKIIDSLYQINPNAKVMTMGDLNDGPYNKSVKEVLNAKAKKEEVKEGGMFNPMYQLYKEGHGTIAYRDAWDIFDQIILSEPLLRKDYSSYRYWKVGIFNKPFLVQKTGQYKGYPLRNQLSGEPGFSDHFPVYIYLIKEQ